MSTPYRAHTDERPVELTVLAVDAGPLGQCGGCPEAGPIADAQIVLVTHCCSTHDLVVRKALCLPCLQDAIRFLQAAAITSATIELPTPAAGFSDDPAKVHLRNERVDIVQRIAAGSWDTDHLLARFTVTELLLASTADAFDRIPTVDDEKPFR